ncbi:FBP domain-containing protein [Williamsia sterculiae]|uniref:FBP C-terminal treble-clef zinc-finger n=1 Tax=Williamsia sterculiae TaxID=1344003 RepID=A0A1N7HC15_9NOCA|nr:FBP domain-containing protein [Williamsia sterculiae]SIS22414.1 FBP C-terminal treble-clef zinc-finger [Williamsia sterculiae]
MDPLTASEIRDSFVNCSKGETTRIGLPDLDTPDWEHLDFIGWSDPASPSRCYLVTRHDGRLVGVALRPASGGSRQAQMCKICLTTHPSGGVSLMNARKAGAAGRQGNSVGTYICSDLACSLYARNKKSPSLGRQYREDLDVDAKVDRVRTNLAAFVARVEH